MEEIDGFDGFLGIIVLVALGMLLVVVVATDAAAAVVVVAGSMLGFPGCRGFGDGDALSAMFITEIGFWVSSPFVVELILNPNSWRNLNNKNRVFPNWSPGFRARKGTKLS